MKKTKSTVIHFQVEPNTNTTHIKESEEQLHRKVVDYLRYQYHDMLFYTTLDGMKLSKAQAGKAKHFRYPGTGWPDIFIPEPSYKHTDLIRTDIRYHGLFIELKKEGTQLFRRKDGTKVLVGDTRVRKAGEWWDKHIEEQAELHKRLRERHYAVVFACGFDQAKIFINHYFNGEPFDDIMWSDPYALEMGYKITSTSDESPF